MLNRRHIRIRAMQTLYAYKRSERANYDLAQDDLTEAFAPNLNSMAFQDKELLGGQKKEALAVLRGLVDIDSINKKKTEDDAVQKAVSVAYTQYINRCERDKNYFIAKSVQEAETAYDTYLLLLQLLVEIANLAEPTEQLNGRFKLANNKIVKKLKALKNLEYLLLRRNLSLDSDFVQKLYREAIKNNERYDEYIAETSHTDEEDHAILKYLLKNVLFKHEIALEYFENLDLYWFENLDMLRSMMTQAFDAALEDKEEILEQLDDRWFEVRDFMVDLIKKVITQENELNAHIKPKLKAWDLDRINDTDHYIIKIALVEMLDYPSIPVKVTFNEAIEIAKLFNPQKGALFVNGILDALQKELTTTGQLKKSGRGLIDNR